MMRAAHDHPDPTGLRPNRRAVLRSLGIAGASAILLCRPSAGRAESADDILPDAITAVMQKPRYANSAWCFYVADVATGEPVIELNPDRMALTGSCRKLFSVGLALAQLGPDHQFTTPVYRRGPVDARGALAGDLVLVAAGDLTFGGRRETAGSVAITDFDHNDANNLGTAILTPQDPLHALDSLAQQVHDAGIRSVTGDVVIDDRLFESFRVPNQNLLITPIVVNENMVDVTVSPTRPGEAASVEWRPRTAAFAVDASVTTVAAGMPDSVVLSGNGRAECIGTVGCAGTVSGDIPIGYRAPLSDSPEIVQTFRIEDPAAFARTAFIEALDRAGVTVSAPAVAPNPTDKLPASNAYAADELVAEFVSPPYIDDARLILKVSLNLGASLSLMLFGLTHDQRTIDGALAAERATLIGDFGLPADSFDFPTNGSGSPDSRATPRATVQLLREIGSSDVGELYQNALPILGVDGSLAHSGVDLPAKGHVFGKTGTTLADGQLKAQNLAGFIDAKSGRRLAFAVFLNDAGPVHAITDVTEVFEDESVITNAIYESF